MSEAAAPGDFDAPTRERLAAWLADAIPGIGAVTAIERLAGGQSNPTFRVESQGIPPLVLRRKPPGQLLASAHAVDREYRVISALWPRGFPVPRAYAHCTDTGVIGSEFFIMEYVAGRLFEDTSLPGVTAAERTAMFDSMNEVLATLHGFDPAAIGLGDFGRPGNFVARQVDRWSRQYKASETESIDAMDQLIAWLPKHLPKQGNAGIVHGDFTVQNVIFHRTLPRVIAVLDWELSTTGDPLVDLAYNALIWRLPPDVWRAIAGLDLPALGIPSEAEYVKRYCERTGRTIAHWEFYLVFCMFRLAAILQGIMKRSVEGNAAADDARVVGARARRIAEIAWESAQRI